MECPADLLTEWHQLVIPVMTGRLIMVGKVEIVNTVMVRVSS